MVTDGPMGAYHVCQWESVELDNPVAPKLQCAFLVELVPVIGKLGDIKGAFFALGREDDHIFFLSAGAGIFGEELEFVFVDHDRLNRLDRGKFVFYRFFEDPDDRQHPDANEEHHEKNIRYVFRHRLTSSFLTKIILCCQNKS